MKRWGVWDSSVSTVTKVDAINNHLPQCFIPLVSHSCLLISEIYKLIINLKIL